MKSKISQFLGMLFFFMTSKTVANIFIFREEITARTLVFDFLTGATAAIFLVRLLHKSQKSDKLGL